MFAKAAEDVQGKLTDGLFALLFTPAAFFWIAGLATWTSASPGRLAAFVESIQKIGDVKLLLYGAGALALVVLSGAAYESVNGWFLQRLIGYWQPFDFAAEPLRARWRKKIEALVLLQNELGRSPADAGRLSAVAKKLHYLPAPQGAMPTAFGCAIVASDRRIYLKYGLSSDVCWAPLSYVIPEAASKAVGEARGDIEASGRLIFWTLASLVWIAAAPRWPSVIVIVGAVAIVATFGYRRLVQQGRIFGDTLESAFDIGRAALYKTLRLPLPATNDSEPADGRALTMLIYRGLPSAGITFTP